MARKALTRDADAQMALDVIPRAAAPEAPVAAVQGRPARRRRTAVRCSTETMSPDAMRALAARSDMSDLGSAEALAEVEALRRSMDEGTFDDNGDPLVRDRTGRLVDGRKVILAAIACGVPRTFRVVDGVDPEARFAMGDATVRRERRAAGEARAAAADTPPFLPSDLPGPDAGHGAAFLALVAEVADCVRFPVLPGLTAREVSGSLLQARSVAAVTGLPVHVVALVHRLVTRAAPHGQGARFMRLWGMPLLQKGSAPALLVASPRAATAFRDPLDALGTCAMAWRLFRDGTMADPHAARDAAGLSLGDLLSGLAHAPRPSSDRPEGLSYAVETFRPAEMREILAASGRPFESWTAEEIADLGPLVVDAQREGGLRLTGETRKFRSDGVLVDGFRVLMASCVAGVPLRTVTARGLAEGYEHAKGIGRRQSYGHRMQAMRALKPYDVASVIKMVACYMEDDRVFEIGVEGHRIVHRQFPTVQRSCMLVNPLEKVAPVKALAALHLIAGLESRALADAFMAEVFDAVQGRPRKGRDRHATVVAVVDALARAQRPTRERAALLGTDDELDEERMSARSSANHGSDAVQKGKLCWLIQAWNAWVEDRKVVRFVTPQEGFPHLRGPARPTHRENG